MNRGLKRVVNIFLTFGAMFIIGMGMSFYDDVIKPAFSSPTSTPYSTSTPRPIPTPTKRAPLSATYAYKPTSTGCYDWSEVTTLMIGREICVTGIVVRNSPVAGTTTQIRFTDDENKFFLASGTFYYPDVGKGDCVMAHGIVLKNTYGIPYIDIDDGLQKCE